MAEVRGRQIAGPGAVELHDDLIAVVDEPRLAWWFRRLVIVSPTQRSKAS